jgi:hypothetical protein
MPNEIIWDFGLLGYFLAVIVPKLGAGESELRKKSHLVVALDLCGGISFCLPSLLFFQRAFLSGFWQQASLPPFSCPFLSTYR